MDSPGNVVLIRPFVYDRAMDVESHAEAAASRIAATIGEPARARMLFCLLDGRARTSTELAIVADVSPSTASAHLARLLQQQLVTVLAQGKHRYYSLNGLSVASVLEALMVLAGVPRNEFVPNTPPQLRPARTCYDHMAGSLAVSLHDSLISLGWLVRGAKSDSSYELSCDGARELAKLGIGVDAIRARRRRFAFACVDWSERRPHIGGALGAALLETAVKRRWVIREPDSRVLNITPTGIRELRARFAILLPAGSKAVRTSRRPLPRNFALRE